MTFESDIYTFHSGEVQRAAGENTFDSVDPATGRTLAKVHTTTRQQLDAAVRSAQAAFPTWSQTPAKERAAVLLRAAQILRERNDELALTETLDTGKPLSETKFVDVVTGADVLEFNANLIASIGENGDFIRLRPDAVVHTVREPLGVCAGIGAWNYPIQIALWKSAPCLAAGNCMVYKPSEETSLHANTLAQIYIEAGLPKGAFNVVYGNGADVGAFLVEHPLVKKVSFTGQVSTGSKVASAAAQNMKSVTMELGGKSPLLILPDSEVSEAVDIAMVANFYSTGQVCTNGTRVFVPEELLPRFEEALVKQCKEGIRVGLPQEESTNFGPVVSQMHRRKVLDYIKHGKEVDGAKVLYEGPESQFPNQEGAWVPPVVFTNCSDDMKIVKEEIFGPVMSILPYSTKSQDWLKDLISRANNTELGLAAGVVSSDVSLAQQVVQQLHAGITWINTWGESPAEMSVGGWKLSGLGVENGVDGFKAYTRSKSTLTQYTKGACGGVFSRI